MKERETSAMEMCEQLQSYEVQRDTRGREVMRARDTYEQRKHKCRHLTT